MDTMKTKAFGPRWDQKGLCMSDAEDWFNRVS